MKSLQARIELLNTAKEELISSNFGLEDIIRRIFEILQIIILEPKYVTHPIIIPLFGFSAVGKTTLIRQVIAALDLHHSFAEIDVRDLANNTLIHALEDRLGTERINDSSGEPLFVLLDEIDNLTKHNSNFDDCYDLWGFLSDGIISNDRGSKVKHVRFILSVMAQEDISLIELDDVTNSKSKEEKTKYQIQKSIRKFVADNKYRLEAGAADFISADEEENIDIDDMLDNFSESDSSKDKDFDLTSSSYSQMLYAMIQHFCDNKEALPYSAFINCDPDSLICFMDANVNRQKMSSVYDFSRSVVFLCGNFFSFDHAKYGPASLYDADQIREITQGVTEKQLKEHLAQDFTPKQINRFESNIILFPSVSKQSFQLFIEDNLNRYCSDLRADHEFILAIEPNVYNYIYGRGVDPLEGYRPLKSEIARFKSVTFVLIAKAMVEGATEGILVFDNGCKQLVLNYLKADRPEQIKSLRDSTFNDEKVDPEVLSLNCIDLAGKFLVYAKYFNTLPSQAVISVNRNYPNVFLFCSTTDSTESRNGLIRVSLAARALSKELFDDQAPLLYAEDLRYASLMLQDLLFSQQMRFKDRDQCIAEFNLEVKYVEEDLAKFFQENRKTAIDLIQILHKIKGPVDLEMIFEFLEGNGFSLTPNDNYKITNRPYSLRLAEMTGNIEFAMPPNAEQVKY
jgi:hypothetical protein